MSIFDKIGSAIKDQLTGNYNPLTDGPLSGKIKDGASLYATVAEIEEREEKAFRQRFLLDSGTAFPAKAELYKIGERLCWQEGKRLYNAINTIEAFGLYSRMGMECRVLKYSGKYKNEGLDARDARDEARMLEGERKRLVSVAGDFSLKELEIIQGLQDLKIKNTNNKELTEIIARIEKAQAELDKERKFLETRTLEIKMKLFALAYALHETAQKLKFAEIQRDAPNRDWSLPDQEMWEYEPGNYLKKKDLLSVVEFIDQGLVASLAASIKADAFLVAVSRERGVIQESIFKMKEVMEELLASLQAYDGGEGGSLLKSGAKNFLSENLTNRAELFFSSIYGGKASNYNYMEVYDHELKLRVIDSIDHKWVETGQADKADCWYPGMKLGSSTLAWREKALTPQEIEILYIEKMYKDLNNIFEEKRMQRLLAWFKPQFTEALKEWGLVFEKKYAEICKNPAVFINKYQTLETTMEKYGEETVFPPIPPNDLVRSNMPMPSGTIMERSRPTVYTSRFIEDVDGRPDIWAKVSGQGVEGIRVTSLNPKDELAFIPPTPEEQARTDALTNQIAEDNRQRLSRPFA